MSIKKKDNLTDTEKRLKNEAYSDGYTFGIYEAVEGLERYTGYDAKELLEALVNRGTISEEDCDTIVQRYGVE